EPGLDLGADVGGEEERGCPVVDAEDDGVVVPSAARGLAGHRERQHAHATDPASSTAGESVADGEVTAKHGTATGVVLVVVGRHQAGQPQDAVVPEEGSHDTGAGVEPHAAAGPGIDD